MRLAIVTILAWALAAAPVRAAVSSTDASFVQDAQTNALGNYALASVARGKTLSPQAKSLAQQVAADAARTTDFIRTYAKSHGVSLDNKPSIQADSQYGNISSDKGSSVDRDFAQAIYIDSNIALDTYRDEAAHGSDPALRNFAKQQVSALERFAKTARKISPQ